MSDDPQRVLLVNDPIDNMRGVTQRVKEESTIDNTRGVTRRVYVVGGGGGNIDELNVTPSTSAQTITASGGVDGYSPVNVAAVDSTIDANIVAGNIKDGVSILGVTGSYTGNTPTGTMYIISNGTYNVSDKAIANVQVPTTAPAHYIEFPVDANGILQQPTTLMNLNNIVDVGERVLYYKYAYFNNIPTSVNFSSLQTVSGKEACYYAFNYCSNLTSASLPSLTTISGDNGCKFMFNNCSGLTSFDLSLLTTVSGRNGCGSMFAYCTSLTTVSLPSLTTISGEYGCNSMFERCSNITTVSLPLLTNVTNGYGIQSMFAYCTSLTTVSLPSLTTINGGYAVGTTFRGCTNLTTLSFPSLTPNSFGTQTTQFNSMLQNVTGCTVHFPSNIQSTIGSWASVTGGFGGTNTTVLFDLPATVTLTGADTVEYTRNPNYDTATALAWKVGAYGTTDFTPAYYTSGTTDPAVSDTIYSDAACTTPVTTISSIA